MHASSMPTAQIGSNCCFKSGSSNHRWDAMTWTPATKHQQEDSPTFIITGRQQIAKWWARGNHQILDQPFQRVIWIIQRKQEAFFEWRPSSLPYYEMSEPWRDEGSFSMVDDGLPTNLTVIVSSQRMPSKLEQIEVYWLSAVAVLCYKDHKVQNLLAYVILKEGVKEQLSAKLISRKPLWRFRKHHDVLYDAFKILSW